MQRGWRGSVYICRKRLFEEMTLNTVSPPSPQRWGQLRYWLHPWLVNLPIRAHRIFSFCWVRFIVDGTKKNKLVLVHCLFGKEFFSLGPRVQAINVTVVSPGAVSCTVVSFCTVSILWTTRVCVLFLVFKWAMEFQLEASSASPTGPRVSAQRSLQLGTQYLTSYGF